MHGFTNSVISVILMLYESINEEKKNDDALLR